MSSLVRYAKSSIFKPVYKHSNYLVYLSDLLNYAKTKDNTIVKGSPIVNMGRGLGRVNNCTLLERSSSIPRMFFVWNRLLFISWGRVQLSATTDPTSLPPEIQTPPQKRVLLSRRRYLNSASLPFPFLHILSKQGFFFTTSPDARNIKVVPIGKQHFLSFGDKKILLTNVITFLTKVT